MIPFLLSILPNVMYLLMLKMLDSFALARWRMLALSMLYGFVCCLMALLITNPLFLGIGTEVAGFSVMPLVEELLKAGLMIWLICRHKIRFMAEAIIYGASIGGGFSLLENIVYFYFMPDMAIGTAVVRGFGCAILHMGCTAVMAIILLIISYKCVAFLKVLLALVPSVLIHFLYNESQSRGLLHPMLILLTTVVLFVFLFLILFNLGEKKIYKWMDHSINTDIQTRSAILNGTFSSTKAGEYLLRVREQFVPEVFFDMICYVQLFLELKIEKQSCMLLSQAGFESDDIGVTMKQHQEKKKELASLARNIGKTGMWVLLPLIQDDI